MGAMQPVFSSLPNHSRTQSEPLQLALRSRGSGLQRARTEIARFLRLPKLIESNRAAKQETLDKRNPDVPQDFKVGRVFNAFRDYGAAKLFR